ncbi:hypothetical protein GCM10010885_21370 [Alicyclobacillus cellulosilyticus]|uniref:Nudix hydrolase domain-containing protein n=1 Tax=Alicyclobacillus cellulosilyticus TaxID=1003997 RepID=A0A917NNU3_9BACL|nr:NUDIX domain-containing protein [Alicyclobacillus cellulosilyticus]GGJ11782.1 hypothetical protein GCM10010885_21370 [Alicyclobacillus cellulosilyticus]
MPEDFGGIVVAAGGVVIDGGKVLLVQVAYGRYAGHWMIPGGQLEPGESLEACAVREVYEETRICVRPLRIVGVRSGVTSATEGEEAPPSAAQTNVYVAFAMASLGGEPVPDGREVRRAEFRDIHEALTDPLVFPLSKDMIRSALLPGGLHPLDGTSTPLPASYRHYLPYVIQPDVHRGGRGPTA